jgi:hypothetical protein
MLKLRHVRAISVASITVTVITVASWGVVIWAPVSTRAMVASLGLAAAGTPTAAVLWSVRWVRRGAMVYLVDAMLTQRARSRSALAKTQPLRVVR